MACLSPVQPDFPGGRSQRYTEEEAISEGDRAREKKSKVGEKLRNTSRENTSKENTRERIGNPVRRYGREEDGAFGSGDVTEPYGGDMPKIKGDGFCEERHENEKRGIYRDRSEKRICECVATRMEMGSSRAGTTLFIEYRR